MPKEKSGATGRYLSAEEAANTDKKEKYTERRRRPLKRKIEKDEHGDYFWTLGEQVISINRFDSYEKAEKDLQRFLKRL